MKWISLVNFIYDARTHIHQIYTVYLVNARNKAYAANYHMLKSKTIKTSVKMQIYKTVVRPVATYGFEIWTLTKSDENLLRIFERKILRKIYGPVQEGDTWRIRYNEELNGFIKGKDIVKFIKE